MISNLAQIDHVVLFFFLGVLASWLGSDLEIPDQISKFLSIFLLTSIGLKGGHEVAVAEDISKLLSTLILGLSTCAIIPVAIMMLFRSKLGIANAAALAASYGSVSAVTLITAQSFLENQNIPYNGYMVAVMALMEIPAIAIAIAFYRRMTNPTAISTGAPPLFAVKSVLLLVGGFTIGFAMSDSSWKSIMPVVKDGFKGALAFFLIDLGISAQRKWREVWNAKWEAVLIGVVVPILSGVTTIWMAKAIGIPPGDQVLIALLAGSASYIAAPAAVRSAIPEASASLYVALPLSLTFPLNVTLGIPLYIYLSQWS